MGWVTGPLAALRMSVDSVRRELYPVALPIRVGGREKERGDGEEPNARRGTCRDATYRSGSNRGARDDAKSFVTRASVGT